MTTLSLFIVICSGSSRRQSFLLHPVLDFFFELIHRDHLVQREGTSIKGISLIGQQMPSDRRPVWRCKWISTSQAAVERPIKEKRGRTCQLLAQKPGVWLDLSWGRTWSRPGSDPERLRREPRPPLRSTQIAQSKERKKEEVKEKCSDPLVHKLEYLFG